MATSAGEVEVTLTTDNSQFKQGIGDSQNSLNNFGNAIDEFGSKLLATFSFAAIADFFKNSIEAYAEQQLAVVRLTAALGAHGIASEQLVDHLNAQAIALEALTGIQANSITQAQTLLTEYGLQGPVLDKATTAAVDLSAGLGIDLNRAAILVAKAFDGNITMLSRYGITIDKTVPPAQQFSNLLGEIEQRFGAVATAQAGTFTGQLTAMGNAFTHLEESVGQLLSGPAGGILGWFKSMIDGLTQTVNWLIQIKNVSNSFVDVLQGVMIAAVQAVFSHMVNVLSVIVNILSKLPLVGSQFAGIKSQVDLMKQAIVQLDQAQQASFLKSVTNDQVVLQNEKTKQAAYTNTAKVHMDVDTAMNAWIKTQSDLSQAQFMKALNAEDQGFSKFANDFTTTQTQMWTEASSLTNSFFSGVGMAFAKMIMEGKNFSDAMKALFQNMAEQMISYVVQIIAKMLVLLGLETALGLPVGAFSFFPGFATGGVITEPSVIVGLQTGSHTMVGEAGPETVSPMNGGNQGAVSGSGSGGSITVNIQGQFLEADQNTWNRLVRDQIIPQIRRFTMTSPAGPFNRTRGVV